MKCANCNQAIVIHDSLLPGKNKPVTDDDKNIKGMIFTKDGLRNYHKIGKCEVC